MVFIVHGIGQRLKKSNLVDDVIDFHEVTSSLAERHLSSYQLGMQRFLFIPCQWRKGLQLSSKHVVDKITLDGVRKLLVMLSAIFHDVLYYMSPIYSQAIIDSAKVFSRFEVLKNSEKNYTIEVTPDDRSGVLQQGGIFIYKGKELLCVRKDKGTTGDHAPLDDIINVCCKVPIL